MRWCFHTTAMVADYEHTRDVLMRVCGLRVLEDSRLEDPAIGRRGGMAWIGDNILEVGEPIVAGGAVDRFVQRFGSHMSSIAVQVADTDATVSFLEDHGVRIASRVDEHIVFTHPQDTGGVVVEWFGDEEALDPRFGAAIPAFATEPLLEVTAMAFGGAVVDDPAASADRLAELFGRTVTFLDPGAAPGMPQAGVSMGDMTLALYPLPAPGTSEALWGWRYERPQTCNLGVLVPDLDAARTALAGEGIPLVRSTDHELVVDPAATGGVVLVVVDELLPADPRH